MSEKTVENFVKKANEVGRSDFKYESVEITLRKLSLINNGRLSNTADALFCSENPLEVQAAVFAGKDKLTFLDIKQLQGNIFDLLEESQLYIKNHIDWRVKFGKLEREEIPEIPLEAVREALVNSMCHKDYRIPKSNEIAIFRDRVEIYNPGTFPEGLTPEGFIKQNRALFLLDGLDEVPGHLRPGLTELAAAFWLKNNNNRFLLTGRPHGIDDEVTRYFGRFLRDIELLDDKKIREFIRKWFRVVSGQTTGLAEKTAAEMTGDIEVNEYVSVFTQNPLLLTAVCVLYLDNKRLPDQQAELYSRIVDNLLYRRFHRRNDPGRISRIEDYLKSLAFKMMTENRRTMDIGEAKELLSPLFPPGKNKTTSQYKREINALFNEIEPQCGLLERVGGQGEGEIEFFHLSFQEFLAARHILYLDMDYRQFLDKEWWEETLLLYTGLINREWKDKANGIVKEILTGSHDDEKVLHRWWLLGGKALRDIQEYKRDEKVTVLARKKLGALIVTDVDLKDRFEAGEILGVLGDPRIKPPPMVNVEAGEFTMGSDEREREQPIHQVYLDEFMIGRYPVTNEEFKDFMSDDGYKKKEFWTPESWQWLKEKNITAPLYWHDRKWNGANFPVVGVSWYEADAYAKWLSQTTGDKYALPTEAQWEKSARGSEGLIYPWGNGFNKNLCNNLELGLKRTSPVGIFPGDNSPYGCMDIVGNVWEWCADWYGKDYYKESPIKNPLGPSSGSMRVIRGGGWGYVAFGCRAAFRGDWGNPANRVNNVGFRLSRLL